MSKIRGKLGVDSEDFLAKLTTAAYGVALCHGLRGSFLDTQLEIWAALRDILKGELFDHEEPSADEPSISIDEAWRDLEPESFVGQC